MLDFFLMMALIFTDFLTGIGYHVHCQKSVNIKGMPK